MVPVYPVPTATSCSSGDAEFKTSAAILGTNWACEKSAFGMPMDDEDFVCDIEQITTPQTPYEDILEKAPLEQKRDNPSQAGIEKPSSSLPSRCKATVRLSKPCLNTAANLTEDTKPTRKAKISHHSRRSPQKSLKRKASYSEKRIRNNLATRRSRQKKKEQEIRQIEELDNMMKKNEALRQCITEIQREIKVLKRLAGLSGQKREEETRLYLAKYGT